MSEAVQGVQAANQGITAVSALIEAAKGLTQAARSADVTNRNSLAGQYNEVLNQITKMANDSGYKGKNFLTGDTLSVLFNENGGSFLNIQGFDGTANGLGIKSLAIASSSTVSLSGNVRGAANVAIHQASLDSSLPSGAYGVSTHVFGIAASGSLASGTLTTEVRASGALGTSGIKSATKFIYSVKDISGLQSGLYTGGITINKVYANGVDVTSLFAGNYKTDVASGSVSSSGRFTLELTHNVLGLSSALQAAGQSGATATGVAITLDVTVGAHTASGKKVTAGSSSFKLQVGDQLSGLNILKSTSWNGPAGSAIAGATHSGLAVFVDGVYKAQGSGWSLQGSNASGNARIVFDSGIVPPSSTVTYAYNSGYVSKLTDPTNGGKLIYGGSSKLEVGTFDSSTQSISNVKLDGKALSGSQYSVSSGGTITLAAGVKTTSFASKLTYDVTTSQAGGWDNTAGIEASVNQLNTAVETLRTQSSNLAANLNVVTVRQDFTDGMIAVLQKGADNLTLADMNEEGANMLMLQTRQQLGTTSLKMASDAAQSVLRLF
jgi:flagellin-like hook-associated protein FlgL